MDIYATWGQICDQINQHVTVETEKEIIDTTE